MATAVGLKPCQCSPDCTYTLRADSSWRFYRGHSPEGKLLRAVPKDPGNRHKTTVKSFISQSSVAYNDALANLQLEADLVADEIDRLEDQAVKAETTAREARDQAALASEKHGYICSAMYSLKQVLNPTAEPRTALEEIAIRLKNAEGATVTTAPVRIPFTITQEEYVADTQSFPNIDAAKWERIKDLILLKVDIKIEADHGTASAKGIELTWTYNLSNTSLIVTLDSRKFFDPSAEVIDLKIADMVANA